MITEAEDFKVDEDSFLFTLLDTHEDSFVRLKELRVEEVLAC
jgi:hypothetical protein